MLSGRTLVMMPQSSVYTARSTGQCPCRHVQEIATLYDLNNDEGVLRAGLQDTGDTRETPAIDVCHGLISDGADLCVYDPQVSKDQIHRYLCGHFPRCLPSVSTFPALYLDQGVTCCMSEAPDKMKEEDPSEQGSQEVKPLKSGRQQWLAQ